MITLKKAAMEDAPLLYEMQKSAFHSTYLKYRDDETSPYTEELEKTVYRLTTRLYFIICEDGFPIGGLCVKFEGEKKVVSPIFLLPEKQGKDYGAEALRLAEDQLGKTNWMLDTIAEEEKLCRFYEQNGYRRTGEARRVNERMTLVVYEK